MAGNGDQKETWGADTMPSMPMPTKPDQPILVSMGGFGFTAGGITHDINQDEWEELVTPLWAPIGVFPQGLRPTNG